MVSLFNGISTLFRLFNAKAILLEEQLWYYLTHSWEDKGAHTFPRGICPKVNVIARLGYELAYYDSAVHRFKHYTTRTPPFFLHSDGFKYCYLTLIFFFLHSGGSKNCYLTLINLFSITHSFPHSWLVASVAMQYLPICRDAIGVFYSSSRLNIYTYIYIYIYWKFMVLTSLLGELMEDQLSTVNKFHHKTNISYSHK